MSKNKRLTELLIQISGDPKYIGKTFSCSNIYFKISDGEIWEVSKDFSETARGDGGDICTFRGPSKEENDYMEKLMNEIGFDEFFFTELIEDYGYFSEKNAREYFQLEALEYMDEYSDAEVDEESDDDENEDDYRFDELDEKAEKKARTYLAIVERLEKDDSPFGSIYEFAETLQYYGLESDGLYYWYEGEICDFQETCSDAMEPRGTYENLTDDEWIEILENIDKYIE